MERQVLELEMVGRVGRVTGVVSPGHLGENEALIISGRAHRPRGAEHSLGFKIATGGGTLVMPGVSAVRRLLGDATGASGASPNGSGSAAREGPAREGEKV